jgi:radical SAM protein with 4Fe4S-binding SPASM domain
MGERFATVKWNGDVYPCSHLHDEGFRAGSVLQSSFQSIWERSPVFDQIRRELGHVEGHCGTCSHNPSCKGCRAVMQYQTGHWLAADHECAFAPAAPAASEPRAQTSSPFFLSMLSASE